MANIDEITKEILAEARQTAEANIAHAKSEAADIISAAEEDCKKAKAEMVANNETAKKVASDRAKSSAAQQKRQAILKAKQELIATLLDHAYDKILNLEDKAYFELMENFLKVYSLPKSGEIYFSKKDLDRLPTGFDKRIEAIAAENGGSLTLSKEPKIIDGGFILSYNGIEENCSVQAIFHAKRETLADKVHEFVFS